MEAKEGEILNRRTVIIPLPHLLSMFKDYIGPEDLPADAWAKKFRINKAENGKLEILAESDSWREGLPPLAIAFDIKRYWRA